MFSHDEVLATVLSYTVGLYHTMITVCINSYILRMRRT